ncbi:hypothetical protein PNOK_0119100 [Pyrrhoderma noxium]|uniref:Uncharacterized protein n=1 Tax=Pyrrhoderma noxium TaxID=2282107 RepID=A0A286UWZ7_9AGAM|nr:hypothetical protein PNOK_0119100 [Pyrrhoderma noxium]
MKLILRLIFESHLQRPVADINARQTVTSICIVNAAIVIPPLNGVTIVTCSAGQTCIPAFIPGLGDLPVGMCQ